MGPLERIGSVTIALAVDATNIAALLARVAAAAVSPSHWRRTVRAVFLWQVYFSGVRAVPFIVALGGLIGVIVVMQAQLWLRDIGQSTLLAPLLVAVLVRELAPLMVNLILIGRSGNAMTVELGNMAVTGELRTLEAQGVDPFGYLVVPRVIALVVSGVCLTVIFILVSVTGGYLCGLLVGTNPGPPLQFHDDMMRALSPTDAVNVLAKSVIPPALTAGICCSQGLAVRGGINRVPPAAIGAMGRSVIATFAVSVVISVFSYL